MMMNNKVLQQLNNMPIPFAHNVTLFYILIIILSFSLKESKFIDTFR
jgi:uncharacterized membrane protein